MLLAFTIHDRLRFLHTGQVENVLYRVPRHFFQRDSEMFAQMFTLPVAHGKPQDGSSDDQPLHLEDQEPGDLEAFLSLLYPE